LTSLVIKEKDAYEQHIIFSLIIGALRPKNNLKTVFFYQIFIHAKINKKVLTTRAISSKEKTEFEKKQLTQRF